MKRICEKLPLEDFVKSNSDSLSGFKNNVKLYVDLAEKDEIIKFLSSNDKRWKHILITILKPYQNRDVYGSEPNGLMAMKFNKNNARIYCNELSDLFGKKIVMSFFLPKKDFQKASNKKIKEKLKVVSQYEYEYREPRQR